MSINEVESKTQAKVHVPLATRFLTKMLKMFTGEKTASLADRGLGTLDKGGPVRLQSSWTAKETGSRLEAVR